MSICMWACLLWLQNPVIDEELRVSYVLLDVKATDRRGRPIEDLTKEDFIVTENKKKVSVSFFEKRDFNEGVPEVILTGQRDYDRDKAPSGVRQIIVALDLESLDQGQRTKTFAVLRGFLKALKPPYTYLINLHSLERGSLTDGFVSSPQRALSALDVFEERMSRMRFGGGSGDLLLGDGRRSGMQLSRGPAGSGGNYVGEVADFVSLEEAFQQCARDYAGMGGGARQRCISDTLNQFMAMHQDRTERVLGELEILAATYTDTEALKLMFFVSPGFTMREPTSAVEMARFYLSEGQSDGFSSAGLLNGRSYNRNLDLQRVLHSCIRNRVIFHTFDMYNTGAVQTRSAGAQYQQTAGNQIRRFYQSYVNDVGYGLQELADESGGSFTRVFDLDGPMIKAIEKNHVFYVLGYDSPAGQPGKYRKIRIKTKRKKVKLAYRGGYFGG